MEFEHYEDELFFASLLAGGNVRRLNQEYSDCFDFRALTIKRREFNRARKELLPILLKRDRNMCQLRLECCDNLELVVDHVVPLSSNKLNRKLRGMISENHKKPKSQSFGSNNLKNLVLACKKCNSFKKHRFINPETRELI